MGAEQSSSRGSAAAQDAPKKTDYYELLGIERQATEDEIKKAYRKKALELHPDRNYGDVERATQKFAEVQSAYEVLSDPQERGWYDSHRDAILRGDDPNDVDAAPEFHNVRVMTAEEVYALIGRFNKAVPMDDSPHSFFTILAETFDRLAMAEIAAFEMEVDDYSNAQSPEYPPFGCSDDKYQFARRFYSGWQNFATRLNFSWKDKWRLSDAPDRRVRRLMEKENKKFREDAARDFNDAVRSLVIFVRKRDPRYVPNTQSEAERQKILRDSAAAQAARSRAANQAKMNDEDAVPGWARGGGSDDGEEDAHLGEFSESEESEVEVLECVVCDKVFKSDKQFESHEKSKKHIKAVHQLQRQMRKENKHLDLKDYQTRTPTTTSTGATTSEDERATKSERDEIKDEASSASGTESVIDDESQPEHTREPAGPNEPVAGESGEDEEDDDDDEYASREAVESRLGGTGFSEATSLTMTTNATSSDGAPKDAYDGLAEDVDQLSVGTSAPAKKMGKAKAKREKKAAKQAAEQQNGATAQKCAVCNEEFESRTKLFAHINDEDHAELKSGPASSGAAKSSKKKKGKR